jgi:diguanylate cyclase (GGDEF)-like protein
MDIYTLLITVTVIAISLVVTQVVLLVYVRRGSRREEQLTVINRFNSILVSSLDIEEVFDNLVKALREVVDVNWAAIVLTGDNGLYSMAISSEIGLIWKVGERLPLEGTATESVISNRKPVVEPDLSEKTQFVATEAHLEQGLRSVAYLPLIAKGKAIGSLIVASRNPNTYNYRNIVLLEQLASQLSMPIENSRLYTEVSEKARIDELTGLLNRRSLDETITSEINRHDRYGGVFSLIILDLDSFKDFNDNYGHLAGDELLKEMGRVIKRSIRGADQAFRYGGDEFAILLPHTRHEAAERVAERVRRRIDSNVFGEYRPTTASLGLTTWPASGKEATQVIASADEALYQAKRSGGNQLVTAAPPVKH